MLARVKRENGSNVTEFGVIELENRNNKVILFTPNNREKCYEGGKLEKVTSISGMDVQGVVQCILHADKIGEVKINKGACFEIDEAYKKVKDKLDLLLMEKLLGL